MEHCANCSAPLQQEFSYCPQCGQKTHLHRLSLHDVGHDALHYFTHADKGVFQLLKSLALHSGTVAREYVAGKRKKYFPPLNFFLLVATVFVLIISLATSHTPTDVAKEHPELNHIPDAAQRMHVRRIYERQAEAIYFINKYSNIVAMIAVPLICFLFWLFYRRSGYNYTEHLVACMYLVGFTNLVYALLFVPLSLLLSLKHNNASLGIVLAFMMFQICYSAVFYYRFMHRRSPAAAWKATGVATLVTVFWFALTSFLVGAYIANGLWGLVH